MERPRFVVGEIVDHTKFGYRGVVFAVDATFNLTDEWYDTVAQSRPPKDAPWYSVMVDGATDAADTRYVAERHLTSSSNRQQIEHPLLGQFFARFDGRYHGS